MICFVAETAVRRLLNRIHSALYAPDNGDLSAIHEEDVSPYDISSLNKPLALSSELNRQLEEVREVVVPLSPTAQESYDVPTALGVSLPMSNRPRATL